MNQVARSLVRGMVAQTLVVTAAAIAVVAHQQKRLAELERLVAARTMTGQQVQVARSIARPEPSTTPVPKHIADRVRGAGNAYRLPNGDLACDPVDSVGV